MSKKILSFLHWWNMLKAWSFLISDFCHFLSLCAHLVWHVASKTLSDFIHIYGHRLRSTCSRWHPFSLLLPLFTQHTTWQYKYGRVSPRLRQSEPGLRSVSRLPPIRGGIVTRDVRVYSSGRLLSLVHTGLLLLAPCCRWLNWRVHSPARTHRGSLARKAVYDRRAVSERARAHTHAHTDAGWNRAVLRWQEAQVQQGRLETFANYFRDKWTNWDGDNVRPPAGCVLSAHLV